MVGHTYLEFGRLRQEDCEFQVSLGYTAILYFKNKQLKERIR
jgi:hypothetical protein